jgi:hypothetical protein
MLKIFAGILLLLTISPITYAACEKMPKQCEAAFEKAGAVPGEADCLKNTGRISYGLGTYACHWCAERWCNFGLESYDESQSNTDNTKVSDKEASQALDEAIKDLCAIAHNYVVDPSLSNAIDAVTKVPGSYTLIFNAGNLSRMAKAKTNKQRASAGLDLYSSATGLGGISATEQTVSKFNRLIEAFDQGPGGLRKLGQELAMESKTGGSKPIPRSNLPPECK